MLDLHHHARAMKHLHSHLKDLVCDEVQSGGGLFEVVLPCWRDLKKPERHTKWALQGLTLLLGLTS